MKYTLSGWKMRRHAEVMIIAVKKGEALEKLLYLIY